MKIAIASQNRQSVTAHVGRCRHFFIFDTDQGATHPPCSLELDLQQVLHVWQSGAHPLDGVSTVIAGSIGQGVSDKLAQRGIHALTTSERDLMRTFELFLNGMLPTLPMRLEEGDRNQPERCPHTETGRNEILGAVATSMTRKG